MVVLGWFCFGGTGCVDLVVVVVVADDDHDSCCDFVIVVTRLIDLRLVVSLYFAMCLLQRIMFAKHLHIDLSQPM